MSTSTGRLSGLATAGILIVGVAACAPPPAAEVTIPQSRVMAEIKIAPPPPRSEEIPPPPPGQDSMVRWDPGHWRYTGNDWVWVQGHYIARPSQVANWVPGHWAQAADGGWVWEQGHWI